MKKLKVKNRCKEVAQKIVCEMKKGENQGVFMLTDDNGSPEQSLTTRERYDAVDEVLSETGVKVGLSTHDENCYRWETI